MALFDFWRRKKKKERPVIKRTVHNLQIGDIVSYNLEDYLVVGYLVYEDSGWRWKDYHLKSGNKHLWLSVEQDDELELGMFEMIPMPMSSRPGNKISHGGKTYYLDEASDARIVTVEGEVGAAPGQWVNYWDFWDEAEEECISVEEWDGDFEVSLGRPVEPYELEILAGS